MIIIAKYEVGTLYCIFISRTLALFYLHDAASARQASCIVGLVQAVLGPPLDSPAPPGLDGVKHWIVEELSGAVVICLAHQLGPAQALIRSGHRHQHHQHHQHQQHYISSRYQANSNIQIMEDIKYFCY